MVKELLVDSEASARNQGKFVISELILIWRISWKGPRWWDRRLPLEFFSLTLQKEARDNNQSISSDIVAFSGLCVYRRNTTLYAAHVRHP